MKLVKRNVIITDQRNVAAFQAILFERILIFTQLPK
jgi:hypothetical protein